MPARWTAKEEGSHRANLKRLYVRENKTIGEIAEILDIAEQTVFQRLQRLDIPTAPLRKLTHAAHRRDDIFIPLHRTAKLAEFFGIMLGDGHIARYQVLVTLGTKEISYVRYVQNLMRQLFCVNPHISVRKNGYHDVYIGSRDLVEWLLNQGIAHNKVKAQSSAPTWLFDSDEFLKAFLRGFFDTDGSIYALRFGMQLSFTNESKPLLRFTGQALRSLHYMPSLISKSRIYLTKRENMLRFFEEIRPANLKHKQRFKAITKKVWAGRPVGGGGRL